MSEYRFFVKKKGQHPEFLEYVEGLVYFIPSPSFGAPIAMGQVVLQVKKSLGNKFVWEDIPIVFEE